MNLRERARQIRRSERVLKIKEASQPAKWTALASQLLPLHSYAKHGCRRGVERFMTRWTVFDTNTASVVASQLVAGGSMQLASGDPLAAALAAEDQVSYALLPSEHGGQVILARIERKRQAFAKPEAIPSSPVAEVPTTVLTDVATAFPESPQVTYGVTEENRHTEDSNVDSTLPPAENSPIRYEAGGFLGLTDEPVFPTDYRSPKKWWQRLLK